MNAANDIKSPDKKTPIIETRSLAKEYIMNEKTIKVLYNCDFTAYAGEKISIIGKSGVGKSTLLQVIGTLDKPTEGEVFYEGRNVFLFNERRLAAFRNRTIGFVFQFHYLLPDFDALENVKMPGLISGLSSSQACKRAEELLVQVGLQDRLYHRPGELSGGEQQRIAIARALVMQPKVLLADELTGNLDGGTAEGIHALLHELNTIYNTTIIVVTHNRQLAAGMQRSYELSDGGLHSINSSEGV